MKKEELKKKLEQLHVPKELYNLNGIGRNDERYCLEFTNHEWQVYFSERGIKTIKKTFTSEDAACNFIYEELSN